MFLILLYAVVLRQQALEFLVCLDNFFYFFNVFRYYDQFVSVEAKLPFTEDQVRVNFTWYDAFAKGSLLSSKPKLTISSGAYEKVCVLFNIAAIQSQVASVQSRETDDGLKLSAKLFQVSRFSDHCILPVVYYLLYIPLLSLRLT